jgi:fumarylacetoacetase
MSSPDYSHHFSVHNVPFGIASSKSHPEAQGVTRLGSSVIFLHDCHTGGLFEGIDGLALGIFSQNTLNEFAALPKSVQQQVRKAIQNACHDGKLDVSKLPEGSTADIADVQMHMPVRVGDFAGTVLLPLSLDITLF